MVKNIQATEQPLYFGHRARLRSAFFADNGVSMPDYELLELLLTFSIPRRDVKPLAKYLIAKFGNIYGVINAPTDELLSFKGISKNTAVLLKMVHLCQQYLSCPHLSSRKENVFSILGDFINYCAKKINNIPADTINVFFFDDNLCLLREKRYERKKNNTIDLQNLIYEIIFIKATQIVLAHKKYSADAKPDSGDVALTENISDTVALLGVKTLDHIIFSNESFCCMSKSGKMPSPVLNKELRHNKILAEHKKLKKLY